MFTVFCPWHDARVLIWTSDIDGISNVGGEIHVDFHCACGWEARLITGRRARERVVARHAATDPHLGSLTFAGKRAQSR